MRLIVNGRAILLALIALASPASADVPGRAPQPVGRARHATPPRALPPEVRYRDPRYVPPRRPGSHLAGPAFLIEGYLPRYTDAPMYNEPPSRFPR